MAIMEQTNHLGNVVKQGGTSQRKKTERLGEIVERLLGQKITPQQARFGPLMEFWCRLLPPELAAHCRIADIEGGQMKLLVDSPVYLYELELCYSELLVQLQHECPLAKIKKIKFVVG